MQHPLGMLLKCCLSNLTHLITSVPFADRCPLSSEQASSIKGEGPEPETRARARERTVFTPSKHPEFSLPNYSPTSHCYIPIGLMVIFWIQLFLLVFLLLLLTELTKSTNNNGSQNPDTYIFLGHNLGQTPNGSAVDCANSKTGSCYFRCQLDTFQKV